MKKLTNKKLSLSKETLTSLETNQVKGGVIPLTIIIGITIYISEIGNCSDKRGGCAP